MVEWLKKAFGLKTSTSAVRHAYLQCMLASFKGKAVAVNNSLDCGLKRKAANFWTSEAGDFVNSDKLMAEMSPANTPMYKIAASFFFLLVSCEELLLETSGTTRSVPWEVRVADQ